MSDDNRQVINSAGQRPNVDVAEIAKFDAVAARWWDQEGEFKPLHLINPVRLDYILRRCNGLYDRCVLDIGCGGGILAESMARQGAVVTGLDMGIEPLQVARLHALESGLDITYLHSTVEEHAALSQEHNLPQAPELIQYDVITCLELLEHVPDPASIIAASAQLLKPGGDLFISTLTRSLESWLLAIITAEYILGMVPKGTHDHSRFIRPSELLGWTDQHGLIDCNISGFNYHPLSGNFTLSSRISANYIVHLRKPNK